MTNPNLNPFLSNNLDVAVEYYLSREAYLSASAFAKGPHRPPGTRVTSYLLSQLGCHVRHCGLDGRSCSRVNASGGRDKHTVEISSLTTSPPS